MPAPLVWELDSPLWGKKNPGREVPREDIRGGGIAVRAERAAPRRYFRIREEMVATESDLTEAVIFNHARGGRISMRSHSGEIDKMESVSDRIVNRAQVDEVAQGGLQLVGVIEVGELCKVIDHVAHNS